MLVRCPQISDAVPLQRRNLLREKEAGRLGSSERKISLGSIAETLQKSHDPTTEAAAAAAVMTTVTAAACRSRSRSPLPLQIPSRMKNRTGVKECRSYTRSPLLEPNELIKA